METQKWRSRFSIRRWVYLLPSLFTLANLLFGFYAIVLALRGEYAHACLAIVAAYAAVWRIQSRVDAPRLAHAKAIAGAVAAGVPFPVAGTLVGGLILALSGLRRKIP